MIKKHSAVFLAVILLWGILSPLGSFAREAADQQLQDFLVKFIGSRDFIKLQFYSLEEAFSLISKWYPQKEIDYIEQDYQFLASFTPNDPKYGQQWYQEAIKADLAWEQSQGDGVVVAVLDSGVDLDHPDLLDNIWTNGGETAENGQDDDNNGYVDDIDGWDFIDNDHNPNPDLSDYADNIDNTSWQQGVNHGTVVAGIIAAVGQNEKGIIGTSFQAQIMPIRTLNSLGVGSTSSVAKGINYAVANGADIINLSFTGSETNQTMENALQNAYDNNVLVVASAGNSGKDLNNERTYPACSDLTGSKQLLGVAAVNRSQEKPSWSNYGSDCVDISAPGTDIYSTVVYDQDNGLNNYYQSGWQGTSVSSPLVAGTAALLKAIYPQSTVDQLIEAITDNAVSLAEDNPSYSGKLGGLLDANASLGVEEIKLVTDAPIVTGAGPGGGPHVRILDQYGELQSEFFAFAEDFRGGVTVSLADLNSDNDYEVVVGPGPGGGPQLRIFDLTGNLIDQFFAYDENFRGGVNIALGDVDNDQEIEIIAGAGSGGGPQVRIFDAAGQLKNQFFAYGENFRGGVYVAAGDLDNDGTEEIITGTGDGGGPQVRTFDNLGNSVFTPGFFAYGENFRGGVIVAAGDLNSDGQDEIITGTGVGGGPQVRTFDRYGNIVFTPGFFAYGENFRGGVLVTAGDLNGDGQEEIITGTGVGGGPQVRTFDRYSKPIFTPGFFAFGQDFRGGVQVGSGDRIVTTTYEYGTD